MGKLLMFTLIVVSVAVISANSKTGRRQWLKGIQRTSELNKIEKRQWRAVLPSENEAEVNAYISEMYDSMFVVSRDEHLEPDEFRKSYTLVDFSAGKMAILVNDATNDFADSPWERLQSQTCFIMDFNEGRGEIRSELNKIPQGAALPMGETVKYVAKMTQLISREDLDNISTKLSYFCRRATNTRKSYILELDLDSSAVTTTHLIRVLGPVVSTQPMSSVPFEIRMQYPVKFNRS